jgi:hypothetical protein
MFSIDRTDRSTTSTSEHTTTGDAIGGISGGIASCTPNRRGPTQKVLNYASYPKTVPTIIGRVHVPDVNRRGGNSTRSTSPQMGNTLTDMEIGVLGSMASNSRTTLAIVSSSHMGTNGGVRGTTRPLRLVRDNRRTILGSDEGSSDHRRRGTPDRSKDQGQSPRLPRERKRRETPDCRSDSRGNSDSGSDTLRTKEAYTGSSPPNGVYTRTTNGRCVAAGEEQSRHTDRPWCGELQYDTACHTAVPQGQDHPPAGPIYTARGSQQQTGRGSDRASQEQPSYIVPSTFHAKQTVSPRADQSSSAGDKHSARNPLHPSRWITTYGSEGSDDGDSDVLLETHDDPNAGSIPSVGIMEFESHPKLTTTRKDARRSRFPSYRLHYPNSDPAGQSMSNKSLH